MDLILYKQLGFVLNFFFLIWSDISSGKGSAIIVWSKKFTKMKPSLLIATLPTSI